MKSYEWVGTKEAADLLNVSQRTIQKWIDDGKIMSTKTLGGHRRVKREDLFKLLSNETELVSQTIVKRPLVVVLVEDEAFIRRLCELAFQAFNTPFELYTASNGYEGLRLIGKHQPDLLLTDLKMPGIDGFSIIRELQRDPDYRQLRIVVITGVDAKEIQHEGGLPEGVTLLGKPIPFDKLNVIFAERAAALGLIDTDTDTDTPNSATL